MFQIVFFLTLLTQFESSVCVSTCVPNSIVRLNGKQCRCDKSGLLNENNCQPLTRRQTCAPGHIIKDGCYECICKIGGEFHCSNRKCPSKHNSTETLSPIAEIDRSLNVIGKSCIPFKSYYVNCSMCVCPQNGISEEAQCIPQGFCLSQLPPVTNFLGSQGQNICIPNIIYIYPCLQCPCTDVGTFDLKDCVETCPANYNNTNFNKTCHPKSYYKKICNICYCPEDGIVNEKYCEATECHSKRSLIPLKSLIENSYKCEPHRFSKPKCLFCDCGPDGIVNEKSCTEMQCTQTLTGDDYTAKGKCNMGDIVPYCIECFCIQSGYVNYKYCVKSCSLHSKLNVLQMVIKDSFSNASLINPQAIKENKEGTTCTPNAIYLEDSKYCLCPASGDTRFKICIAIKEVDEKHSERPINISFNLNMTCEPLTFVQFNCNTCFCKKNGRLDPKWCTSDDCQAKKAILDEQNEKFDIIMNASVSRLSDIQKSCIPGSITKVGCNFCICSDSGKLTDKACTRNVCSKETKKNTNIFTCEPLTYFEVDCNICFCPRNGIKNVAKCTKSVCESYLRSQDCIPGELYSESCNICVCPPEGTKKDSVCTNRDCEGSDDHWNTLTKLSQTSSPVNVGSSRVLNLCFPGEEFSDGCKSCICPDMGLKAYSICVDSCNNNAKNLNNTDTENNNEDDKDDPAEINLEDYYRKTAVMTDDCLKIDRRQITAYLYENPNDKKELEYLRMKKPEPRKACTPGSQYIINCQQCMCPLQGDILEYCRPLPSGVYCDLDARRQQNITTVKDSGRQQHVNFTHYHTVFRCNKPGRFMDNCYMCECEESGELILEHCYKSSSEECKTAKPTFLKKKRRKAILGI